ncbi:MAG: SMC-Scp complex subunit ScpB [Armatimonadetes bacterium]|nr:SMC-Scp complex subunit ScpB [Armatimonadota bacterium]
MDQLNRVLLDGDLKKALECMLFVTPQPLSVQHVAKCLNIDELEIERAIHELRLDMADRGLQIVRVAGGYQMCTRPEYADYISALLKPVRTRLSRAALETVAIIAYRQPITQPEIDAVRGVNSDGVIKTLLERNLIRQVGRRDTVGRPILYGTTEEFLNYFGLNDLSELPELGDIQLPEAMPDISGAPNENSESLQVEDRDTQAERQTDK